MAAATAPRVVVYGIPTSRVCKVLWALGEVGVPCERVGKTPMELKQDPEYMAMNPKGTVPTAVFHWPESEGGTLVLNESNTITSYIAHRFDERKRGLYPSSPEGLALAWQWLEWGETTLAPRMSPVWMGLIRQTGFPPGTQMTRDYDERTKALRRVNGVALDDMLRTWSTLEDHLKTRAYIAAPFLTIADFTAGVQANRLFNLPKDEVGEDLQVRFTAVHAWYQRLLESKAYQECVVPFTGAK